jgi:hypothetical protein
LAEKLKFTASPEIEVREFQSVKRERPFNPHRAIPRIERKVPEDYILEGDPVSAWNKLSFRRERQIERSEDEPRI